MTEEYEEETEEEIEEAKVYAIEHLPEKIRGLTRFSEGREIRETLHLIKRTDDLDQDKYIKEVSLRVEIGIRKLNKVLKEIKEEDEVKSAPKKEEDPHWLKVYKDMRKEFPEDKIVAMSDSRQLMLKRGNIFTPDIIEFIQSLSKKLENYKTGYRNVRDDVIEKFKDSNLFDRKNFCYDPYIINFPNGYYDINKKENEFVKAEDNDKMFFYEIPYEYDENFKGDCPKFKKALKQWLGKDNFIKPEDLLEFMGYTMTMGVGQKKAFLVYGKTNTGKTQFQEILKALIGERNTSETSLHRMGEDKFGFQDLEWKILNYFDDLSERALYDVSLFKVVAGGTSTITIEEKNKKPYKTKNTLKMWFYTNTIPPVKNIDDDSFFERWAIIIFRTQFTHKKKNRIPYFYKTIIEDKDEMQGIIHLCIKALKRLHKRKHFRVEVDENIAHLWNYLSDPSYRFNYEYLRELEDGEYGIICADLLKIFNEFRNGIKGKKLPPTTINAFNKSLEKHGVIVWRPKDDYDRKLRRYKVDINKKCKRHRKIGFMQEKTKRTVEYYEEHPEDLIDSNGEPKIEHEDMGEFHFTNGDYNNKDRFNKKATKLIKGSKVLKNV